MFIGRIRRRFAASRFFRVAAVVAAVGLVADFVVASPAVASPAISRSGQAQKASHRLVTTDRAHGRSGSAVPPAPIIGAPSPIHPAHSAKATITRRGSGAPVHLGTKKGSKKPRPAAATAPNVPTDLYADNSASYSPFLHGTVSSPQGGNVTGYFTH